MKSVFSLGLVLEFALKACIINRH